METCIDYCEKGFAYISSDERKWINRITELSDKQPGECIIIRKPDENNGAIYAKFPQKWLRIMPPRQVSISDEERAKRAEKLREFRSSRTSEVDEPTTLQHEYEAAVEMTQYFERLEPTYSSEDGSM